MASMPRMSRLFFSLPQLLATQTIDGVLISEVQHRARPGGLSYSGFLSESEHLLSVLEKDWKTVENHLLTTHLRLSEDLSHLLKLFDYNSPGVPQKVRVVNTNKDVIQILGTVLSFRGFQKDLLHPSNYSLAWNTDIVVENRAVDVRLRIAGDYEVGLVRYIADFGFYEGGGDENIYRVDPCKLYLLLYGKSPPKPCLQ